MVDTRMLRTIEILVVGIAGVILIIGLLPPGNFALQVTGIIISLAALGLSFFITIETDGDPDVGDITLINALLYPLIVGCVLAIGSWFDSDATIQSLFLDFGLIMGIALVYTIAWNVIKQNSDFLDQGDVDLFSAVDKEQLPRFFLVTLVIGALYGALFFGFKVLYHMIGYNTTVYTFMGIIAILALILIFVKR